MEDEKVTPFRPRVVANEPTPEESSALEKLREMVEKYEKEGGLQVAVMVIQTRAGMRVSGLGEMSVSEAMGMLELGKHYIAMKNFKEFV